MLGFNQFLDDLKMIEHALHTGQRSAAKVAACDAMARVRRFANTLENLDLHTVPETPVHCGCCGFSLVACGAEEPGTCFGPQKV